LNVNLIINPIAGNKAFRSRKQLEDLIKKKAVLKTFITRKKGDAVRFAKEHADTDRILVAGGDGTFNEALNGLLSSQRDYKHEKLCPLAFIPLGTTNVLAKELGIPENIPDAVNLALTGNPKKITPARINGHFFVLMAGIGFDGQTVYSVNNRIKRISGKGAYIFSGFKTFFRYNPSVIQLKASGASFTGYTVVIGKSSCYGGYFKVTPKAKLTEPVLDVCLLQKKGKMALLGFISRILWKRHLKCPHVFYGKFSEIEITAEKKVHVQTDGDYFGTLPVTLSILKDTVTLIC
jgi:YegS/Rv2252/BmrU family lipid kinase